mmetsp:Transcript_13065/g.31506  ORF Transcript_13065/g.31506 Transcript_13065/m.31506 type:complete len:256 (-) Transcript_13065:1002-1769(-)
MLSGICEDTSMAQGSGSHFRSRTIPGNDSTRRDFIDHALISLFIITYDLHFNPRLRLLYCHFNFSFRRDTPQVGRQWLLPYLGRVDRIIVMTVLTKQSVGTTSNGNPIISGVGRNKGLFKVQFSRQSSIQYRIQGYSTGQTKIHLARFLLEMTHKIHGHGFQISLYPRRQGNRIQGHLCGLLQFLLLLHRNDSSWRCGGCVGATTCRIIGNILGCIKIISFARGGGKVAIVFHHKEIGVISCAKWKSLHQAPINH